MRPPLLVLRPKTRATKTQLVGLAQSALTLLHSSSQTESLYDRVVRFVWLAGSGSASDNLSQHGVHTFAPKFGFRGRELVI